jgi:hypothetical protein
MEAFTIPMPKLQKKFRDVKGTLTGQCEWQKINIRWSVWGTGQHVKKNAKEFSIVRIATHKCLCILIVEN